MYNTLQSIPAAGRPGQRRERRAFTLVELLVVIGIIALLIAILIPVIGAVRRAAYKTNTANEIGSIATAIDSYYADFKAYPGPIAEANLMSPTNAGGICTSSQNLVWGLEGGWEPFNASAYSPHFSSSTVGQGAMSFNNAASSTPGTVSAAGTPRYRTYLDATYLLPAPWSSSGSDPYKVSSSPQDPTTSQFAPVYVDRYPATKTFPSPILYLRAHTGVVGVTAPYYEICTSDAGFPATYDNTELTPYANVYKELAAGKAPPVSSVTLKQDYPSWTAYFADPNTVTIVNGSIQTINGVQPAARHADSYLLISPGYDGQFGTADDISN